MVHILRKYAEYLEGFKGRFMRKFSSIKNL